jgi:hypothetical protein
LEANKSTMICANLHSMLIFSIIRHSHCIIFIVSLIYFRRYRIFEEDFLYLKKSNIILFIMNRFQTIFNEINRFIKYMMFDEYIIYSKKYFQCMNEIIIVLENTLSKIHNIYFKYILYPKIKAL